MFNMFHGEEKTVKMRFSNRLANVVIDRFGEDVVLAYDDEKHFTFTTVIETSPQFYGWLCGLGRGVRVVSPPEVVEAMGNYVKGILPLLVFVPGGKVAPADFNRTGDLFQ